MLGSLGKQNGTVQVLCVNGTGLLGWGGSRQGGRESVVMPYCSCLLPVMKAKDSGQCSCEHVVVILQVAKAHTLSSRLPHQSGGGCKHWSSADPWPEEFPQLLEGSCGFPAFSTQSLSLVCPEAVHSAFSCLTGVTALYICV